MVNISIPLRPLRPQGGTAGCPPPVVSLCVCFGQLSQALGVIGFGLKKNNKLMMSLRSEWLVIVSRERESISLVTSGGCFWSG